MLSRKRSRFAAMLVGGAVAALGVAGPAAATPAAGGLAYSSFLGGTGADEGKAIAVDAQGSAYITGYTSSSDYPTTVGAYDASHSGGNRDAFVTKFAPSGAGVEYSTYLGGLGNEEGNGIAVDGQGSAYVTGFTESVGFPTTAGAYDTTHNGGNDDAFVTKLAPSGTQLAYSTFLGGGHLDFAHAIAVDALGSAYVTGQAGSGDFPTTPGAYGRSHNGDYDAFVTKFVPSGGALAYSTLLGGAETIGSNFGHGVAVDAQGSAYVAGSASASFPTTAGAYDRSHNGGTHDLFMAKLQPSGGGLVYATFAGGAGEDHGLAIAIDAQGGAYATGSTASADFPATAGAYDTVYGGGADGFATKLAPSGQLAYSTFLGGAVFDQGSGIGVDGQGRASVVGYTGSVDYPTTAGAHDTVYGGGADGFATTVAASGDQLAFSTFLGGSAGDRAHAVAIDGQGSGYVTGYTSSTDYPTTAGAYDTTHTGNNEAVVTKLAALEVPEEPEEPANPGEPVGGTVPATLSLTLSPPASFGAFAAGVAKDYTASMAANVVSTAADAQLSVADASPAATGHLVNGPFSLPLALRAKASSLAGTGGGFADVGGSAAPTRLLAYSGPVSNDAVTLSFLQRIEAGDALRAGLYSKSFTFSLSTTSP